VLKGGRGRKRKTGRLGRVRGFKGISEERLLKKKRWRANAISIIRGLKRKKVLWGGKRMELGPRIHFREKREGDLNRKGKLTFQIEWGERKGGVRKINTSQAISQGRRRVELATGRRSGGEEVCPDSPAHEKV